jgi:hypothetical protein
MNDNLRKILKYPTDSPLKFWLKYWDSYINELCDLNRYETKLDSSHFILNDVVTEIKYNNFKNADNRKLFKDILGKNRKSDVVFSNLYDNQCSLAFKQWDESPLYVKSMCENILTSMNDYEYLNALSQKLVQVINAHDELTEDIKQEIRNYTQLFVTELVCLGVDVRDISELIREDNVCVAEGGCVILAADTFFELSIHDFSNKESYYKAVSKRLEKRNAIDYINNIMKHFNAQPREGHVILRLLGIKGSIDYHIQGIHLYSIDNATYLKESHLSKIEEADNTSIFVNIAIPISHRFFHSSINIAVGIATRVIDFLSLNIEADRNISISNQYAAIAVDGKECGSSESVKDDLTRAAFYRDIESYNIARISDQLPNYLREFTSSTTIEDDTFRKISNATHWYKKAVESNNMEDKLLYSWIAIESVLKIKEIIKTNIIPNEKDRNILNLSKVLCSLIISRNSFYSLAKNNYIYLVKCTQNQDNFFDFSTGLIETARLNLHAGDKIDLADFFNNLDQIIKEMNDEIYKSDLIRLNEFYKDNNGFKSFKNQVCNDITLIYRLRNLIAHNAVYSPYQTKLYAYKAQFICGSLIQAIRHYCNKYELNVDDALLRIYTDCTLFEANIKNHIKSIKESCHD